MGQTDEDTVEFPGESQAINHIYVLMQSPEDSGHTFNINHGFCGLSSTA